MKRRSKIPIIKKEVEPVEFCYDNPYRRFVDYDLKSSLSIPSAVHSQSILTEYIQNFIINKFEKDYFKTVFINGRHVMVDYLRRSKVSKLKVEKPAMAITPIPNREYNREMLDSYMGGINGILNNFNFETSFFKDYENNIFLGFNLKEIEMGFDIKMRVSSRSQQEDLYEYIKLVFRIGYTYKEFRSCDFHIPYDLILNIAYNAGFEVSNQYQIKDILGFLSYLNKHSLFPIIYKMRSVNGNNEFFIRVPNVYFWVDTRNQLSADDGDRDGKLYDNFNIDMNIISRMWTPHFYVYKTAKKIIADIPTTGIAGLGLFSLSYLEIPEINEKGWNIEINTTYVNDEITEELTVIPMEELFNDTIKKIINYNKNMGVSPLVFIDILCINNDKNIKGSMNWETFEYTLDTPLENLETHIGIYIDNEYVNSIIQAATDAKNSRLN